MAQGVYRYHRIDVFTDRPFCGTPLADFTRAQGLDTDTMQRIARELGLSETSFVFPTDDSSYDYSVRIFTPTTELSAGGAPSLGTVFALAREEQLRESSGRFVLEEKGGAISVTLVAPMMTMKQPCPQVLDPLREPDAASGLLCLSRQDLLPGAPPQVVECGAPYTLVAVRSLEALSRIELRMDIWRRTLAKTPASTVVAFTPEANGPYTARARVFAPALGVHEDAATAPACGAIVAFMVDRGLLAEKAAGQAIIEQGVEMGRRSEVHVMLVCDGGRPSALRIGGQCVWTGQGEVHVGLDSQRPPMPGE
jgi:trans-2,3-dihydro-3-hydroxyanthranilate isomerase